MRAGKNQTGNNRARRAVGFRGRSLLARAEKRDARPDLAARVAATVVATALASLDRAERVARQFGSRGVDRRTTIAMSGLACTKKVVEDEDAQELRLGEDFTDAHCLSMDEVNLICAAKLGDDLDKIGEPTSTTQTKVFEMTNAYVRRFAKEAASRQTEAFRNLYAQAGLTDFEGAIMVNLNFGDYEEAIAHLPSLARKGDDGILIHSEEKVSKLIDDMADVRRFE